MMRSFFSLLAVIFVIGLGFWAYHQNILTQHALRDVARLEAAIAAERERLSLLNAEWAYLNRPDRLRALVDMNFDRLGLMPMRPAQFGQVQDLPYPAPQAPLIMPSAASFEASAVQEMRP